MPSTYMTPGVYIEEKNAFPNSVVALETAVPVFIGYTETAIRNNSSLVAKPTRITSFAEYLQYFGPDNTKPYKPKYTLAKSLAPGVEAADVGIITINNFNWYITAQSPSYLYNSIRLFYANGGSVCYILSLGTYGSGGITAAIADFLGSPTKTSPFEILTKEVDPTLVVIPDANIFGTLAYGTIYKQALQHCADMQSRFAILDVARQTPTQKTDEVILTFRNEIGVNNLNYGAAYYPWLKTAIVTTGEVDIDNIDTGNTTFDALLPEPDVKAATVKYFADIKASPADSIQLRQKYDQTLKAISPTYVALLRKIMDMMNELPPSGAMAGLFTMVDNSRGVWKAPANVSINMVSAPAINISYDEQQNLNVDPITGKSINVIREFPGIGTLVWGARTLDGNSQDWRYINVRRTLIMIEQSLKLAARAFVFEPNDANIWTAAKSMMNNFLTNLWKQGALAGAVPEQAFDVAIGLGSSMTATDILDGIMVITVKVAIVRPAEFIVITFQQQMQQS